jgi:hypothetical protein
MMICFDFEERPEWLTCSWSADWFEAAFGRGEAVIAGPHSIVGVVLVLTTAADVIIAVDNASPVVSPDASDGASAADPVGLPDLEDSVMIDT